MPIAHCVLAPTCSKGGGDLVALWSGYSQKSAEHMTVNLLRAEAQFGQEYAVVANLYLPSLWPRDDVAALQTGLARALAEYLSVASSEVLVMTQSLESGAVVENGETVTW